MKNLKRDWPKILRDLEAAGYNHYKLSIAVKRSRSTIAWWLCGKSEPRHSDGEYILAMYEEVYGRTANGEKDCLISALN